jgi:isopenicillin N synthase-like dioxygenase
MNDDARCGSKPARWRCRAFFTKEWMRHEIPEEPTRRGSHTSASLCLDGLTENMDASSPARKAHANEMHEKAGSLSNTCELPWPVLDDMKKRRADFTRHQCRCAVRLLTFFANGGYKLD